MNHEELAGANDGEEGVEGQEEMTVKLPRSPQLRRGASSSWHQGGTKNPSPSTAELGFLDEAGEPYITGKTQRC